MVLFSQYLTARFPTLLLYFQFVAFSRHVRCAHEIPRFIQHVIPRNNRALARRHQAELAQNLLNAGTNSRFLYLRPAHCIRSFRPSMHLREYTRQHTKPAVVLIAPADENNTDTFEKPKRIRSRLADASADDIPTNIAASARARSAADKLCKYAARSFEDIPANIAASARARSAADKFARYAVFSVTDIPANIAVSARARSAGDKLAR